MKRRQVQVQLCRYHLNDVMASDDVDDIYKNSLVAGRIEMSGRTLCVVNLYELSWILRFTSKYCMMRPSFACTVRLKS